MQDHAVARPFVYSIGQAVYYYHMGRFYYSSYTYVHLSGYFIVQ